MGSIHIISFHIKVLHEKGIFSILQMKKVRLRLVRLPKVIKQNTENQNKDLDLSYVKDHMFFLLTNLLSLKHLFNWLVTYI